MKKILLLAFSVFLCLPAFPQEVFVEQSLVVNVEVPVRVFEGIKFIDSLTINDFELFEDGIPQKIEAVYLVKKRSIERSEEKRRYNPQLSRNFFLLFEMSEYTPKLDDALDYFLNMVILPGDTLYVVSPLKTYKLKDNIFKVMPRKDIMNQMRELLRKDALVANSEYRNTMRELTGLARAMSASFTSGELDSLNSTAPKELDSVGSGLFSGLDLDEQLVLYQNLVGKLDILRSVEQMKLQEFAKFLRNIDGQKYVYLFYEREYIPQIEPRILDQFREFYQNRPDISHVISNVSDFYSRDITFDVDTVKQSYADSSISVHFLIYTEPPDKYMGIIMSEHSEDIFSAFKQMAEATGGYYDSSANPSFLFKSAAEASENYYLLYYSPKNYRPEGKFKEIKVRVKDRDYRVVHRAGYFAN